MLVDISTDKYLKPIDNRPVGAHPEPVYSYTNYYGKRTLQLKVYINNNRIMVSILPTLFSSSVFESISMKTSLSAAYFKMNKTR